MPSENVYFKRICSFLEKITSEEADADMLDRKGWEQNNTPVESCRDYFCDSILRLTLENTDLMQKYRVKGVSEVEIESWELKGLVQVLWLMS